MKKLAARTIDFSKLDVSGGGTKRVTYGAEYGVCPRCQSWIRADGANYVTCQYCGTGFAIHDQ